MLVRDPSADETQGMTKMRVDHPDATLAADWARYADVPAAEDTAVIDPHWLELRGTSVLPPTYMPPAMAGARRLWQRATAVGVSAVFLGATAAGVCLTYGPPVP
jgi:hypothetical protein